MAKIKKVLTCGCKIRDQERPFSSHQHNKDCTCESINKKGNVKKSSYSQISIFQK